MTKKIIGSAVVACALLAMGEAQTLYAQTPKTLEGAEFEVASIRVNPPVSGFHFAADSSSGGPGTSEPGMFRCSKCSLATLIAKAFELQNYQFPARTSLAANTFEVAARIRPGATQDEFQAMLRNLLKERFGLAYHFTEKKMRGYQLVLGRSGAKLKESSDNPRPAAPDQHQFGHGDGGGHNGLVILAGSARYRGDHQTTADLARLLADQLSLPVVDQTGLQGKYDISLTWSGSVAHSSDHADGGWGGAGHADHGGGAPAGAGANPGEPSQPTLFDAVQAQLGLRLVPAEQVVARIFVIDRVDALPTAN